MRVDVRPGSADEVAENTSFEVAGLAEAGETRLPTEEELIEGISFAAYRRVSTVIFVPALYGRGFEMVT